MIRLRELVLSVGKEKNLNVPALRNACANFGSNRIGFFF